jgi:hypothetical protein
MQGSIRSLVGFLVAFGAVGTLEVDPAASLVTTTAVALVGLAIMASGVSALKGQ